MSLGSRLLPAESVLSIRSVVTYPLSVPQPAASGRTGFVNSLVVEIVTADGRSGFGESCSPVSPRATARMVEDALAPVLLGADEDHIGALWQRMRQVFVAPVAGAGAEAVSAVDIALWDLLGQKLSVPIHALLAGQGLDRIPAYGSFIGWIDDRRAVAQAELAMQLGFKRLKVKLSPPLDAAIARVTLMRRTVGVGFGLVADPNGSFDYVDAVQLARRLGELGYLWLEEPIDPSDLPGMVALNRHGFLPLAAGESEFGPRSAIALAASGAISVLQPDCGRIGGITGFSRAVTAAATLGVPFAPHHAGGAIKATAALHLAAALPGFRVMECSLLRTALHDDLTRAPTAHPSLLDGDGCLPVPQGAGLGIDVNRETIARLAIH
jgi:L-alanine-DL-glutamate epimerase-like enolase superfamily enzyme